MPILRDLFARQHSAPERREFKLPDGLRHWFQWPSDAGVEVTPASSLRFSAVFACIRILAESVAMLPVMLYEREGNGGRRRAAGDPRHRLLHDSPNPEITAYEFVELAMVHLLLYGNAYAEIELATDGQPLALWPLMPHAMQVRRNDRGALVYVYTHGERAFELPANRVWHVRGVGSNGYTGLSPIQLARQQIGLGLAAETFGSRLFSNGAVPPAVLEYPGKLNPEARANIRSSWEARQGGLDNAMRIAVLEEGMTYKAVGIPPEDVQFLELRRFQIEEIARIYRVPPHMLADLERATFSNIEHLGQSFVTYSLMPWLRRIEQRSNMALLGEDRQRFYYEFMVDALQRGDLVTRTQSYATMINWGIMSPNEARQRENLNDYGEGDVYLMPLNMVPVGTGAPVSGQGPVVSGQGSVDRVDEMDQVDPEEEEEERNNVRTQRGKGAKAMMGTGALEDSFERRALDAADELKLMVAHVPVFEETMARVCRRQAQDVAAAARKHLGERGRGDFALWLAEFWTDHGEWMRAALLPLYRSYGEVVVNAALDSVPGDQLTVVSEEARAEWIERYVAEFVAWHIGKSERKVAAAMRQADPLAAMEAATGLWMASWPLYLANRETVRAGNELSRQVWETNGAKGLEWHTTHRAGFDNCAYCRSMNGLRIPMNGEFSAAGLPHFRSVKSPPLHEECQCVTRPVWVWQL